MNRIVPAAAGAAVLFAIGVATGTTVAHRSKPVPTTRSAPRLSVERVATGPSRSSAVTAAANILYAFNLRTVLDPEAFDRVVARVAAPGRGRQISALFGNGIDEVRSMFVGTPRIARAAPLGFRLLRFGRSGATVAIWNVAIGGGPLITPTAQWRTIVLDLTFARGRWKAAGGRTASGPSPETSLRELAERANEFKEFSEYVP